MQIIGALSLAVAAAALLIWYFRLLFTIERKIDELGEKIDALYQDAVNKAERVK